MGGEAGEDGTLTVCVGKDGFADLPRSEESGEEVPGLVAPGRVVS